MSERNGQTSQVTDLSTIKLRQGLTAADLGDEAVVLDTESGRYFGLNEVGARIFEAVREPKQVNAVIAELEQEFDVESEQLRRDVLAFLEDMLGRGLITLSDA